ncbi:MAG: hypothetical protein JO036_19140 [Candidatus Eremiobacteraeota bacterium]|nr:hypothetical protein [Candidatus Eremiobacteraeota bacterium]
MAFRGTAGLPAELLSKIAQSHLRLTSVAAGPFPEIIGLVEAAVTRGVERGRIDATVYDINADVWMDAARASVEIAADLVPGITVDLRLRRIDVREPPPATLPAADVLTFQNCANEICHDGKPTAATLAFLRSVAPHGAVVLVDFNNYSNALQSIPRLERWLRENGFRPLAVFDAQHEERTPFGYPPGRTFYNFYGATARPGGGYDKLREPRQNLKFSWSVWSR